MRRAPFLFFIAQPKRVAIALNVTISGADKPHTKQRKTYNMTIYIENIIPEIRNIMKKWLLKNATMMFPNLPASWTNTNIGFTDITGNNFVCPLVGVNFESGSNLSMILYSDELALFDENGRLGAWNVTAEGEICWG